MDVCVWGRGGRRYIGGRLGRRVGWLARWGAARRGRKVERKVRGRRRDETKVGEHSADDDRRDDAHGWSSGQTANCQTPLTTLTHSHTPLSLQSCLHLLSRALFSSEKFCKIDTVALSFVSDKYCPIMD